MLKLVVVILLRSNCGAPNASPRAALTRKRHQKIASRNETPLFNLHQTFLHSFRSPFFSMNLSGTVNVFRLILSPTLCLPHHTVSTFNQLPIPLSTAFPSKNGEKNADIRAVILDKDNCFAAPHELEVYEPYKAKFEELRAAYPGSRLLIVSNTAGTSSDRDHVEAEKVEKSTGVHVLRHSVKVRWFSHGL